MRQQLSHPRADVVRINHALCADLTRSLKNKHAMKIVHSTRQKCGARIWVVGKNKSAQVKRTNKVVDPAGLAPASSGTNADMLLYAPRARIHQDAV